MTRRRGGALNEWGRNLVAYLVIWPLAVVGVAGFGEMSWSLGTRAWQEYRTGRGEEGVPGSAAVTEIEERSSGRGRTYVCWGTFTPDDGGPVRTNLRIRAPGDCRDADLSEVRLLSGDESGAVRVDDPDTIVTVGGFHWLGNAAWALLLSAVTAGCALLALGPPTTATLWLVRRLTGAPPRPPRPGGGPDAEGG
ncbi:hypothetical protein FH609_013040 [Streptomyces sp. 3MP-14]|uniref:Uncharacterized protein n=1 Tax=Streptomyces mimosae TaxID=2586635 RepID=A0A5N6A5S2_9ACTN|nr:MULTISPECIES: hypothetical protein [Streptomyces]KAB8164144.1 hypothetical protein FH607_015930 [Streptomyces mimosae]KAB8176421.1 hypothetical protein FH609_013040 [Streptomyces sp. 3MP-14]